MSKDFLLYCVILVSHSVFLFSQNSYAQLSPGDLHEVHAELEGLKNCEKCHTAGEKIEPQKCLDCHEMIAESLNSGKGLHGINEYTDCVACHIDHLGRDSELVYWPDGQDSYDHSLTGFILKGKHRSIKCRECHSESNISRPTLPTDGG